MLHSLRWNGGSQLWRSASILRLCLRAQGLEVDIEDGAVLGTDRCGNLCRKRRPARACRQVDAERAEVEKFVRRRSPHYLDESVREPALLDWLVKILAGQEQNPTVCELQ